MTYFGNDYHIPLPGLQTDPHIISQPVESSFSVGSGTNVDSLLLFSEYVFFSSSLADCRTHLSNSIFRLFL
jgi:hypothetical protein